MVEYWHWASIAANQETYWKGVLSHHLNLTELMLKLVRTAHELQKIGSHLTGLQIHDRAGYSWPATRRKPSALCPSPPRDGNKRRTTHCPDIILLFIRFTNLSTTST